MTSPDDAHAAPIRPSVVELAHRIAADAITRRATPTNPMVGTLGDQLRHLAARHIAAAEAIATDGCCTRCGRILGRTRFSCCQDCKLGRGFHTATCEARQP